MTPNDLREQMEQVLLHPTSVSPEEFHELASTYADLIARINQRVSICNQWIDKGLRSEAVHMASIDPDLLDTIGLMDLGDRFQEWTSLCDANDAQLPPHANWEQAAFLNDAWSEEYRLTPQLREVRVAMLQKASIARRLGMLRTLLSEDPDNLAWDTMIRELEQLRILELEDQIIEASERQDLKRLKAIETELHDPDWLEPPSSDLMTGSSAERKKAKRFRVDRQFNKLADELHAAMSAGDETGATNLRSKWQELHDASKLEPPASAVEAASSTFAWLDDLESQQKAEEEHELACRELGFQLDDQAPIEDLERLHFRLTQLDRGIPPLLENRYQARKEESKRSRRARMILRGTIVSVAIIVLAAAAWWVVNWIDAGKQFDNYKTELVDATTKAEVALAERSPYTDIEKLELKLDEGRENENIDLEGKLSEQMINAQAILDENDQRSGKFNELHSQLDPIKPRLEISEIRMDNLNGLAFTPEEKKKAEELHAQWRQEHLVASARNQNQALQMYNKANRLFGEVEDELDEMPAAQLMEKCTAVQDEIRTSRNFLREVVVQENEETQRDLATKLDDLSGKVHETISRLQEREDRSRGLQELVDQLGNPSLSLKEQMQLLARLHKNYEDFHARDLKRVTDANLVLGSVEQWNKTRALLTDDLRGMHHKRKRAEINDLLKNLEQVKETPLPDQLVISDISEYLQSVQAMHQEAHRPDRVLKSFLDDSQPWAHPELERVVTTEGSWFGLNKKKTRVHLEAVKREGGGWYLTGCVETSGGIREGRTTMGIIEESEKPEGIDKDDLKLEPTGLQAWLVIIEESDRLETPPDDQDTWHLYLLEQLAATREMEPTVRLALTGRIAKMHQDHGWPKVPGLEKAATQAEYLPPEDWPTPNRKHKERKDANDVLKYLDSIQIKDWMQQSRKKIDQLNQDMPPVYVHAGICWLDDDGKPAALLDPRRVDDNVDIYVLANQGGKWKWELAGVQRGGILNLEPSFDTIPVGMPLFVVATRER